jgi:flagellar motor component MotA
MEGILGILDGEDSQMLIIRLNSMVNIKDNMISARITEYLCGDIHALDTCCDTIQCRPALSEREEVVFAKRARALSEKARREGILSLEPEIDKAGIASGDIFEYGLPHVVDGVDASVIEHILDNLIAHESNPVKKNLCVAKKEALLSIQAGEPPRYLIAKYVSHFDEDIRQTIKNEIRDD